MVCGGYFGAKVHLHRNSVTRSILGNEKYDDLIILNCWNRLAAMKLVITRALAHLSRLLQPKKGVKHALNHCTAVHWKLIYTTLRCALKKCKLHCTVLCTETNNWQTALQLKRTLCSFSAPPPFCFYCKPRWTQRWRHGRRIEYCSVLYCGQFSWDVEHWA